MSARRQASTTSLSKFARANEPPLQNRSMDFCNAFWGIGDGGVEVLFARMRGAGRTMDELRNFWKERSAIEEDYAKRLSKLAKTTLGRDEIGELRNSLDTLRLETDNQASFHLELTRQIRTLLEGPTAAFHAKQSQHKKQFQAAIEKEFKAKQTQESYVARAREKYEADCLRINSYTAQSTLVQGKDLEKIHLKLERAQQTVQANERDFANFAKALQDTTAKWELDWKAFCDSCQDMEEDRLNFMKDNLWAYANAVSTVCVADDESCEKMRLALEQTEPELDMENFVRDYSTGNLIPDPPAFINYTNSDAIPSSSSRPTTHIAQFVRSSQRVASRAPPPPEDEEPAVNTAGVGAGGGRRPDQQQDPNLHRSGTRSSSRNGQGYPANGNPVNGHGSSSSSQPVARASGSQPPPQNGQPFKPVHDANGEPIDPTADTMLKIGTSAYRVDLSKDPQQQGSSNSRPAVASTSGNRGEIDPLAKQMEDLKAASGSGSVRRNETWKAQDPRASSSRRGTLESGGPSTLSPPASNATLANTSHTQTQPAVRDYRNSAEMIVGAHPSVSRPSSPNPPTANFMVPRSASPSGSGLPVEKVLADYQQSFPGEGKSISRSNSRQGNPQQGHSHSQSQGQNLARPPSQVGHPGIGAHGNRSPSPQPISRSASPVGTNRSSYMAPPGGSGSGLAYGDQMRATSPNSVGIAIDQRGRVAVDEMADRYQQQRQTPAQQIAAAQHQVNHTSYPASGPSAQPVFSGNPSVAYQQPPVQQPSYSAPQQPVYDYQQVYQPQPHAGSYAGVNGVNRTASLGVTSVYPASSQATRTPSPQPPPQAPPTGQRTPDGKPILFYVQALYDYTATIEEEFDFQADDIIAVTATPEDGWWSGELLDESRRQPGRHVFPSNFVRLF